MFIGTSGAAPAGSLEFELVRPLVALQPRLRAFLAGVQKTSGVMYEKSANNISQEAEEKGAAVSGRSSRKRPRTEANADEDRDEELKVRQVARLEALLASARSRLSVAEKARADASAEAAQAVAEADSNAAEAARALAQSVERESAQRAQLQRARSRIAELEAACKESSATGAPESRSALSQDPGASGPDSELPQESSATSQQILELEAELEKQAQRAKRREESLQLELQTALQEAAQSVALRRQVRALEGQLQDAALTAGGSTSGGTDPVASSSGDKSLEDSDALWRQGAQLRRQLQGAQVQLREAERRVAGLKAERENEAMLAERARAAEEGVQRSEARVKGLLEEAARVRGALQDAAEEAGRLRAALQELSEEEGLRLNLRSSPRKSSPADGQGTSMEGRRSFGSSASSSSISGPGALSQDLQGLEGLVLAAKDARAALVSMAALRAGAGAALGESREETAAAAEEARLARAGAARSEEGRVEAQRERDEARRQVEAQAHRVARLEREISGLQRLLKSYDDEDEAAAQQVEAQKQEQEEPGHPAGSPALFLSPRSKSTAARISMLEGQLEEAREEAGGLRAQLASAMPRPAADSLREELAAAREALRAAEAELGRARDASGVKAGSIASRRADAVREPASGVLPIAGTRVLHMRQNPLRDAVRQRIKSDKEAREKAAAAVNAGGAGAAGGGGGGVGEAVAVSDLDGSILQTAQGGAATVAEAQKLRERLVSQFQQRMRTFREVVYRVLGWKVWMEDGGRTCLFQSQYAAEPTDVVKYGIKREGSSGGQGEMELQLLDTKFVRELEEDLLQMIHTYGSLPAFMANLLGNQFSQTTAGAT